MHALIVLAALTSAALLAACSGEERPAVLRGASPLVPAFEAAASAHDVPAELLAALAWTETALTDHTRRWEAHDDHHEDGAAHAPRSAGVMGLPLLGRVRSVPRAAALLEVSEAEVIHDPATNIQGAAALLRALADEVYGAGRLTGRGERDRWLNLVARYFDAGAAGEGLALEVRRTVAQGLLAEDEDGLSVIIPSYAELYAGAGAGIGVRRDAQTAGAEYPGAAWVPAHASNYTASSRTAADIDVVVIHTVQGSYAGAISWFQNPSSNVSAHYVIRRSDGAITQMVRHRDRAWHVGNYNGRSVGIEHEGWVSDANNYTPIMYQRSAELTAWLCNTLGIPKTRSHLIGHVEAPGATHTDPGRYWDWGHFMTLVNGGSSNPIPGPGTGLLKGVVFRGTDTNDRIAGATVTVSPGGRTFTTSSIGYFEVALAPGTYTVRAEASGFAPNSVSRSVSSGAETWGSVGLTPAAAPGTGVYRGVVYDATTGDTSTRLAGATVRLSSGAVQTSAADGAFVFEVPPGEYTATAELSGWSAGESTRAVTAGGTVWGSIGLVPAGAENRPPAVPEPASPIGGVALRQVPPVIAVRGLADPDGDPLTVRVAFSSDAEGTAPISTVRVAVPPGASEVAFRYPAADLPLGAAVFWRARAWDGSAESAWSEPASFVTPEAGESVAPSGAEHQAEPLPGAGANLPPEGAVIVAPADGEVVASLRPRFEATARAPEGAPLALRFEVADDDLFTSVVVTSPWVPAEAGHAAWAPSVDLPPGTYAVRARAADDALLGAWSRPVGFSLAVEPFEPLEPGAEGARGEKLEGGCRASGHGGSLAIPWVLGALLLRRRRA